ncbi:MAG: diacylglycerol kinase family lipid kinase [Pseudomonadota bacterium]|nr:diacylglycerol kinase family lipid kinase [Pseudomonadota bacterium]
MNDTLTPVQQRLFVALNPVAGSCTAADVRQALEAACSETGVDLEIYETTGQEDLPALVRQALARGCTRIVAAGGDGTVAAAVTALLNTGVPLAILPVGTANLVARELNVPLELNAACRLACSGGALRAIDAMEVGERVFISHISLGTYSRIAERTSALAKRRFRQLAYIWNAIPELLGGRSWRFRLMIDGRPHRVRAAFVMVANVGTVGAAWLRWGPDIQPDDGRIDICVVRARTLLEYLSLMWYTLLHRHREYKKASYLIARERITIFTKRRLPVRGDGEVIGHGSVEIRIIPRGVRILVPDAAPAAE